MVLHLYIHNFKIVKKKCVPCVNQTDLRCHQSQEKQAKAPLQQLRLPCNLKEILRNKYLHDLKSLSNKQQPQVAALHFLLEISSNMNIVQYL